MRKSSPVLPAGLCLSDHNACESLNELWIVSTSLILFINISPSHSLLPLGIPPRAELLSPPTPSAMTHFRSFHTSAPE